MTAFPLPWLIVLLPVATAVVASLIPRPRLAAWLSAGAATVVFLLTCLLPWQPVSPTAWLRSGPAELHLVWLTGLVAMTAAWAGLRTVAARQPRLGHAACQLLLGATLLALLSDSPALTWLAFAAATASGLLLIGCSSIADARRLALPAAAGLMLALFGTLLLHLAAEPAAGSLKWQSLAAARVHLAGSVLRLAFVTLVLGYGTVAWMMPGAVLLSLAGVNVALLVVVRLLAVPSGSTALAGLLIALGLVSLLAAAYDRAPRADLRSLAAHAGTAQIGLVALAFGLGGTAALFAGWLALTALTLTRSALMQCEEQAPTRALAWTRTACGLTALAVLLLVPILLGRAVVDRSPWLMLPLGVGVLLSGFTLIDGLPPTGARVAPRLRDTLSMLPIWAQLAVTLALGFAMPDVVFDWFRTLAAAS